MTLDHWTKIFGSKAAYLRAVERVFRGFLDVATFAVEHSADTPQADDINKYALIAATFNSPDCDAAFRRLATYTLTALGSRDDLTEEQERIRAIAARIYATEKAVARQLKINLYPHDSEAALERALDELKPSKGVIQ
jgi:hypothetical protein